MSKPLFDMSLRAARRDRAFRHGPALFLHDRAFHDIIERIALVRRRFRSALQIGCPNPAWPKQLEQIADEVSVVDPGREFAGAVSGRRLVEDEERLEGAFELCVTVGTLDTVNKLPLALANIRAAMLPDALLIGAISGGNTLPRLRAAMRDADAVMSGASPRTHPRIDGPSLGGLLTEVGFVMPVVDVDKVSVNYSSFRQLVGDLRAMGATNILNDRSKLPLSRQALAAAESNFNPPDRSSRTTEVFEILHFAAWTPTEPR
jgi:hypothetical protein